LLPAHAQHRHARAQQQQQLTVICISMLSMPALMSCRLEIM
jgi:hypothetical protein